MTPAPVCPHCNADVEAEATACPACGASLLPDDPTTDPPADRGDAGAEPAPEAPPPVAARASRTPSFARAHGGTTAAQRRMHHIEWGVVAGLAALLVAQLGVSNFSQLAADAGTRPWLQHACDFLRCTLPPWHEPGAFRMLQRDVQASPSHSGMLRISASFRNDARWAQPWPRLRVTLSDADGRAIAAREFSAREYLGTQSASTGIASGQVASIGFDVLDPSPRVTAFTFEFE